MRHTRATSLTIMSAGALFAIAAPARAQDSATAQALFEQGKSLMAAGNYADACPKLEESQRLDPGGGTLLAMGLCYEGWGKTATAWADFNLALSQARKDARPERERAAEDHIHALEPKLSKLTITAPQPPPGLQVTRDGTALGDAEWGTALPVDPGQHVIEATAPGKKTWNTKIDVEGPGSTTEVTIPALEDAPAPPPAPAAGGSESTSTAPATPPQPESAPASDGSTQRIVGLVLGGAGVVGIGLGSFFGAQSFSHWSDAKNACPNAACPSASAATTGNSAANDAKTAADVSTVAFIAGGAALAAGAIIFFTAPSGPPKAGSLRLVPVVGWGSAGVSLAGAL
jgi:hypothetical protein